MAVKPGESMSMEELAELQALDKAGAAKASEPVVQVVEGDFQDPPSASGGPKPPFMPVPGTGGEFYMDAEGRECRLRQGGAVEFAKAPEKAPKEEKPAPEASAPEGQGEAPRPAKKKGGRPPKQKPGEVVFSEETKAYARGEIPGLSCDKAPLETKTAVQEAAAGTASSPAGTDAPGFPSAPREKIAQHSAYGGRVESDRIGAAASSLETFRDMLVGYCGIALATTGQFEGMSGPEAARQIYYRLLREVIG